MIAIVDYGMGNLRSVEKGFEKAGVADVVVTADPREVASADRVVLPGVGAFRDAAANLRKAGMWDLLKERAAAGTPLLGICLGMQLFATKGLEDGEHEGLGIVPGVCERLPGGVKVPHIGWNTIEYPRESAFFEGVAQGSAFYFVHSYVLKPDAESDIIGSTEYGTRFASAVGKGNVVGAQFHPEKSSSLGLRLLANFAGMGQEG